MPRHPEHLGQIDRGAYSINCHPERSLARTRAKRSRRTCGCLFCVVILVQPESPYFALAGARSLNRHSCATPP